MHKIKDFLNKKRCRKLKLLNQKGFSLLEIMVAVTLMGIITAVAIPSYQRYRNKATDGVIKSSLNTIGRGSAACLVLGTGRDNCNSLREVNVTCPAGLTCSQDAEPASGADTIPLCFEASSGSDARGCVQVTVSNGNFTVKSGIIGDDADCAGNVTPACASASATPTCAHGCTVKQVGTAKDACGAGPAVVRGAGGDTGVDTCDGTYSATFNDLPECTNAGVCE